MSNVLYNEISCDKSESCLYGPSRPLSNFNPLLGQTSGLGWGVADTPPSESEGFGPKGVDVLPFTVGGTCPRTRPLSFGLPFLVVSRSVSSSFVTTFNKCLLDS